MSIVESNYQILDTQIRSIRTEKWRKIHEQEAIIESARKEIERIKWKAELDERELEKNFDPFKGVRGLERKAA